MTTIYACGGEDTSYLPLVGMSVTTNAQLYQSAFARQAIGTTNNNGNASFPLGTYMQTPNFTPVTSFWSHFRHSTFTQANTTTTNCILFALCDAAGVARILVTGTGSNGQLQICKRDASGTITTLVAATTVILPVCTAGVMPVIDLFVNYATSGQATLYINGVVAADTGAGVNITTNSVTQLASAVFGSITTNNVSSFFSEMLIQDTTTLGCEVFTMPPIAAGTTQGWSGVVASINEIVTNDAAFISEASANVASQWTLTTTLPSGTWSIEGIWQEARVSAGATGPQHFEWNIRTVDGTDHVQGSVAPATSPGNFSTAWMTNPHTTTAWVAGDLINAGIESLA